MDRNRHALGRVRSRGVGEFGPFFVLQQRDRKRSPVKGGGEVQFGKYQVSGRGLRDEKEQEGTGRRRRGGGERTERPSKYTCPVSFLTCFTVKTFGTLSPSSLADGPFSPFLGGSHMISS